MLDNIFKGYRKGKSAKVPADNKIYSYDDVKDLDNYGAECRDDVIDISFDDQLLFDKVLEMCEDNDIFTYALYSPHGGHMYFRTNKDFINGKDIILACGIKADLHNKGTYIPLKCDGNLRGEVYENTYIAADLPEWLLPTRGKDTLWMLKDGDGRNDALSKHVFVLAAIGLQESTIKDIFNLINKYILKDKMSKNELSTILRDDTFKKAASARVFDDEGKFKHRLMAEALRDENKIVDYGGLVYMYDQVRNLYVSATKNFHHNMIMLYPDIRDSQRVEVYKYLEYTSESVIQSDKRYISFNNGIYNVDSDELYQHDSSYFITNQVPWNYNPYAYDDTMDSMLDKVTCNDKDLRALLEEMVGYCLFRSSAYKKFFVLTGAKDNGKSTFIFALNYLLGEDNISSEDIPDLEREYNRAQLKDKLANIRDDISDGYFDGKCAGLIKQLVGGNRLTARNPYGMPFEFESYATLIFSANAIPRIKDTENFALQEKMLIIPFNAHITADDPDYDPYIMDKLLTQNAMEYLGKLGVEGLKRLISNRSFTIAQQVIDAGDNYRKENNPILQFIDYDIAEGNGIENENVKDVYARYLAFYSGGKPVSQITFDRQLCAMMNMKTKRSSVRDISGKIPTIFVKNDE